MRTNVPILSRRPFCAVGALLLLLTSGGCGGPSAPASDPNAGLKALQTVLDTWKSGAKPATLAEKSPAIHATDGDWLAGDKLVNYKVNESSKLVGSDVNFDVVLELKTAKGQSVTKTATYAVTTTPQVLVLRHDSL